MAEAATFRTRITRPTQTSPDTTGMTQYEARQAFRVCGWIWCDDAPVSVPMTAEEFALVPEAERAYVGQYNTN